MSNDGTKDGITSAVHDDDPVSPMTTASWQQAEEKLYSAATTRPDLYQRALLLVSAVVARLRELGAGTSPLLAAAARGPELVTEILEERGTSGAELDLDLVARAAMAMRYREVAGEQAAQRRLRRLAEAGRSDRAWVVLEESGDPAGDPFLPYHRLEADAASGRALLVTATPDAEFRASVHAVQPVRVDLATGSVEEAEGTDPAASAHPTAEAREAHAAALREPRDDS
ncbi:MAG: hypothetical protein JWN35_90 [Frankiales bacterium]|jgi:hypothetical protein|nr:hypothetical protein [Frankiales bacterium]